MDKDIVAEAREAFALIAEREADNRREALDDLCFARLGEQWSHAIKQQRQRDGRPCLTINRLPAFIRQVVNDARQNSPQINVHAADSEADPATADVYNGLIRNIEAASRADVAYDTAIDCAVTMGFGYFRINTEYADDDSFDLDLAIKRIGNPFSVWGDPYSTEADSSDWNTAFITDLMTREQFRARYKGAAEVNWDALGYDGLDAPWRDDDRIQVAEYFRREPCLRTLLLLSDGRTVEEEDYAKGKDAFDAAALRVTGSRQARSHKVVHRILTGAEMLEETPWAGKYIPIVPVYGDEVNVEGKRHFRSLIRDSKDSQRMFNFWRTASTELVALAPKAPFIGPKGAFTTDVAKWATANSDTHAFIEYDGQIPPARQEFASPPAGALMEAANASDDIKAIMGLYDASLGAPSNETSGRAILARQREGDVSTFHFTDNLSRAIAHAGRILIDLIPAVYSGKRVVRVLGADGSVSTVTLQEKVAATNAQGEAIERIYDLGAGKYDLVVEAGPSFTTRREESANQMMALIQAYPAAAPLLGDLLAKNLDWPGAEEIAKRLRALVPPQVLAASSGLPSGGAAPAAPAGKVAPNAADPGALAAIAKLQQALAATQAALQALKADKALETSRMQLDAFKAETERLRVVAEAQQSAGANAGAQQQQH